MHNDANMLFFMHKTPSLPIPRRAAGRWLPHKPRGCHARGHAPSLVEREEVQHVSRREDARRILQSPRARADQVSADKIRSTD